MQKLFAHSICHDPVDIKTQLLEWFQEKAVTSPVEVIDEDWIPPSPEPEICRDLPKKFRLNHDENREPKFLSEAYCLCRKSRGISGSYCMPIKREVAVLKRILCDPVTKRFEYIKSVQTITVGCHSVLPRTRNASHLSAHYRLPQGDY
uniref:Interleukin-17 n=1 Tax=Acrobeloides nanus TaxID=290746 RepID=A0A914CNS7_9BILA